MFSTDFIFRQQENLVDNQKSQAGYRPLRNKILFLYSLIQKNGYTFNPFFKLKRTDNSWHLQFHRSLIKIRTYKACGTKIGEEFKTNASE